MSDNRCENCAYKKDVEGLERKLIAAEDALKRFSAAMQFIRFEAAKAAMQSLLTHESILSEPIGEVMKTAVHNADVLLARLKETEQCD